MEGLCVGGEEAADDSSKCLQMERYSEVVLLL